MNKLTIAILLLLACLALVRAQDQRIELTTNSKNVVDLSTTTYDYGTYKNNTFKLGYNSDAAGNKIVAGEVNFALQFEPKWLMSEGYNTEIYFKWCNSDGTICKRPWSMNILDNDGTMHSGMHGRWSFFDNAGNQTASWLNEGFLDFYMANGGVRFRNNTNAVSAYNAALTGSFSLIKLDSTDRVVVSANNAPILLNSNTEVAGTLYLKDGTAKQVTWYEKDSCGQGYKCLRIQN